MGKLKKLAWDAALLTGASLLMRCIGLAYQVWLAGRIGSAGIGLWQLVMSVNVLTATLAISGIRFTTTRLVSEELGRHRESVDGAVLRCLCYAALFGSAACLILFFGAEPIGFLWVGDARTVLPLRIIAFAMPMIALSSVWNGYFIASGQAWKTAAVQVTEQIIGIGCVVLALRRVPGEDLELSCAAVARGNLIADAVSMLLICTLYLAERRRRVLRGGGSPALTGRMLRIAVPLALSAYARTGLTTLENLLVPRKLRSAGYSADAAISGYGAITGMVFPIITFPSCLLSAVAELTVPELTAAQVQNDRRRIRAVVTKLLRMTLLFSLVTAGGLFLFADILGQRIYHDASLGKYIRIFALLVPLMYMDIVTDGCLKGLGQMMRSMVFNISEAFLGVLLVITVLPVWALNGYIFVLFVCETYNFTLSIHRLVKVVGLRPGMN